jgi:hypothetical protein
MRVQQLKNNLAYFIYLLFGVRFSFKNCSFKNYRNLKSDLRKLEEQATKSEHKFPVTKLYPVYKDKSEHAGEFSFQYFYQDWFVAKQIYSNNPKRHIDIASRIDGFVAHVAVFRPIEVFDIRPLNLNIPNIIFKQMDIMDSNNLKKECTDSISCLHAIEHFGLGRYGDPICFEGHLTAFENIGLMLKRGGKFYLSTVFGEQRIEFHAHRVFSLKYLLKMVSVNYDITNFVYVDDRNNFNEINLLDVSDDDKANNLGCSYGCAIFELTKR